MYTHANTSGHTHTRTHTHMHKCVRAHSHTYPHKHKHTQKHTHTCCLRWLSMLALIPFEFSTVETVADSEQGR